jgi:hypothetical protein
MMTELEFIGGISGDVTLSNNNECSQIVWYKICDIACCRLVLPWVDLNLPSTLTCRMRNVVLTLH